MKERTPRTLVLLLVQTTKKVHTVKIVNKSIASKKPSKANAASKKSAAPVKKAIKSHPKTSEMSVGDIFNLVNKEKRNPLAWFDSKIDSTAAIRVRDDSKHEWHVKGNAKNGFLCISGTYKGKAKLFVLKAKIDGHFAEVHENICLGRRNIEASTPTVSVCHIPWVKEQYGLKNVVVLHTMPEVQKWVTSHKGTELCPWVGGELVK